MDRAVEGHHRGDTMHTGYEIQPDASAMGAPGAATRVICPKSKVNPILSRGGAIEVIETCRTGNEEGRDRTGNALAAALDTHPDYLLCWIQGDHDCLSGDHGVTRSH